MPILAMSSGTVTAVWGAAFLRLPNGELKPVKVGDKVLGGQQIVTEDDGLVQITPDRDAVPFVRPVAAEADRVIADLNQPEPEEPPAAGLQGGGQGSLLEGLRVERVVEGVTPLSFSFGTERVLPPPIFAFTAPEEEAQAAALPPVPQPPEPPAVLPLVSVLGGPAVVEGDAAEFTIELSAASSQLIQLQLTPRGGSGNAVTLDSDAQRQFKLVDPVTGQETDLPGNVLSFQPGQTSLKVRVVTVNDQGVEPSETLALDAQVIAGQTANTSASAQDTVLDNDAEGRVLESGVVGNSDPSGATAAGRLALIDDNGTAVAPQALAPTQPVFTFSGQQVVWVSDNNGGLIGRAGSDPAAPTVATLRVTAGGSYLFNLQQTLQHAPGQSELDIVFPVQTRAGATPSDANVGTLTIHVVDFAAPPPPPPALPQLAVESVTVNEGAPFAEFTVRLDQVSARDVVVDFTTVGGTATSSLGGAPGADFTHTVGQVTIPAGATSVTLRVPLRNDAPYEGSEQFTVVLSTPVNATIDATQGTATGTILDDGRGALGVDQLTPDDDRPVLNVLAGPPVVEGDPTVFTIELSRASTQAIAVQLTPRAAQDDPATPQDESASYQVQDPVSGAWRDLTGNVLDFLPQADGLTPTSLKVRLATVNDAQREAAGSVSLTATVVSGVTANATAGAVNTVLDNDFEGTVRESGLAGISDPTGSSVVGRLVLLADNGSPLAPTLVAPATPVFATENGQQLVWSTDGRGGLIARAGTGPDAPEAVTLSLSANGRYVFNLKMALAHAPGQDELDLVFGLRPPAGDTATNPASLTIHVVDDKPQPTQVEPARLVTQDTNLLIVLDTSQSMLADGAVAGQSKWQDALAALDLILDRYDGLGDVAVRLVTFAGTAQAVGDTWLSASQARAALASLSLAPDDTAHPDLALQTAIAAFGSAGKRPEGENLALVLTDSTASDAGRVDAPEAQAWVDFLNANQVRSQAVGLGLAADPATLDAISHDGLAQSAVPGFVAGNGQSLVDLLGGFAPMGIVGRFLPESVINGVTGADGLQHIARIAIGTQVVEFNPAQPEVEINTAAGGTFYIDMGSGDYRYLPPAGLSASFQEVVTVTLLDRDGDAVSGTLTLRVDATDKQVGTAGDDLLSVGPSAGVLAGLGGQDVLTGGASDDALFGHAGDDELVGGEGLDLLLGGLGSDTLTGGLGADVFAWALGDQVAPAGGAVSRDAITDFDLRSPSAGGDVLDLRDLLQGEDLSAGGIGNLLDFLHIDSTATGSTISVSTQGAFAAGSAVSASTVDQVIAFDGVNLAALAPAGSGTQQILADLLQRGKLLVDVA